MTKRNLIAALLLVVFALPSACALRPGTEDPPVPQGTALPASSPEPTPTPEPSPTPEPTPTPDPIAEQLAGMTPEQMVGQLLVAGIEGAAPGADAVQAVQEYQVGGVILFGRNVESAGQLAELTNGLKQLNADAVPLFLCVDEEGGRVSRMPEEVMDLPSADTFGQRHDASELTRLGQTLGMECAAFGFNLDFAPVADVRSNPENTVIGDRAYSGDPGRAADAAAWVDGGMREAGIISVWKHFPGHGNTATDSHQALPVVELSREDWARGDAVPFRRAVECGAPAVMAGHIRMTAFDREYPASLSHVLVSEVLREELGFTGVVCTDDLTMGAISDTYGMGEAAVLAVEAGCDLLLVCHGADNLTQARQALLGAVDGGRISPARLEESVYRILALKAEYGLTNQTVEAPDVAALNQAVQALLGE